MKKILTGAMFLILGVALSFPEFLFAQENYRNRHKHGYEGASESVSSSFVTNGDRLQTRDRIKDPSTHDGDEPIRDRDRTRDYDYI